MSEVFRNNQTALRTCILYEFIEGKSITEAYEHFCNVMGKETMEYKDFEYWFTRFSSGKLDLNHDRSLDRLLSDMPVEIFEKVVKELDWADRLLVRNVSKNFKYLIDGMNPGFKTIKIKISSYTFNFDVDYPCLFIDKSVHCARGGIGFITPQMQMKSILNDLAVVLKNPKLQLDEFHVEYPADNYVEKFKAVFESLAQKVHVKKITFVTQCSDLETAILPYLEIGTLKEIVLDIRRTKWELPKTDELKTRIDRIVELEQYNHAEMLTIKIEAQTRTFPIESFLECRRFTIDFISPTAGVFRPKQYLTSETALHFTKTLLKSTVLEVAILKIPLWETVIDFSFLNQLGRRAIKVPDRPNVRRLKIPKSNEFFQIKANEYSIRIERTF